MIDHFLHVFWMTLQGLMLAAGFALIGFLVLFTLFWAVEFVTSLPLSTPLRIPAGFLAVGVMVAFWTAVLMTLFRTLHSAGA